MFLSLGMQTKGQFCQICLKGRGTDDEILRNTPEAEWYGILGSLPWRDYQSFAADYYNALYDFNHFRTTKNPGEGQILERKADIVEDIDESPAKKPVTKCLPNGMEKIMPLP